MAQPYQPQGFWPMVSHGGCIWDPERETLLLIRQAKKPRVKASYSMWILCRVGSRYSFKAPVQGQGSLFNFRVYIQSTKWLNFQITRFFPNPDPQKCFINQVLEHKLQDQFSKKIILLVGVKNSSQNFPNNSFFNIYLVLSS